MRWKVSCCLNWAWPYVIVSHLWTAAAAISHPVHAPPGAVSGPWPHNQRHQRSFLCGILLHLLPEIHSDDRGLLLPQELWMVTQHNTRYRGVKLSRFYESAGLWVHWIKSQTGWKIWVGKVITRQNFQLSAASVKVPLILNFGTGAAQMISWIQVRLCVTLYGWSTTIKPTVCCIWFIWSYCWVISKLRPACTLSLVFSFLFDILWHFFHT